MRYLNKVRTTVTVLEEKAFCVTFVSCNVKSKEIVDVNVKNGYTDKNFMDSALADDVCVLCSECRLS